jgi:hypothetical protein
MKTNEELITDLRRMSGDYGKKMRGELDPDLTYSWDGGEITAWEAADALEAASQARDSGEDHEALSVIVAEGMRDVAYSCTRVWEAWQYGTMQQEDFAPAWEDEDLIGGIVEDALKAGFTQAAPAGGEEPKR